MPCDARTTSKSLLWTHVSEICVTFHFLRRQLRCHGFLFRSRTSHRARSGNRTTQNGPSAAARQTNRADLRLRSFCGGLTSICRHLMILHRIPGKQFAAMCKRNLYL
jgi:hypothetical protein